MEKFTFTSNGLVILSSGNNAGTKNDFRIGDKIYAAALRPETGQIIVEHVANLNGSKDFDARRIVHSNNDSDGHGEPSVLLTEDDTIVVMNSKHNSRDYYVSRISVEDFIAGKPFEVENLRGDISNTNMTYAWGTFQHADEPGDPIYHFLRAGKPWGPNVTVSRDDGETWSTAEKMIEQAGSERERPYVEAAHTVDDQGDITHIFSNLGHPNRFHAGPSQGVYHMELRDGAFYADGKRIDLPADPLTEMTEVSAAGHSGIYDVAKAEGYIDEYPDWGNAWIKNAVATDGKAYVLWTEGPKDRNLPESGAPMQVWWAGQASDGSFKREYVTTTESSHYEAIRGAGIDPNSPTTVYVIAQDANGVNQLYRHDLVNGSFEMTQQLTDIPTGIRGVQLMDDVPGGVYVSQGYGADGELNTQIGSDVWDRQSEGFFIPNDRMTTSLPEGPKTYTVNVDEVPDTGPSALPDPGDNEPSDGSAPDPGDAGADDGVTPDIGDTTTDGSGDPASEPIDMAQVSFDTGAVTTYDSRQDTAGGTATVSDGGRTLTLAGNAWKEFDLAAPFEVQADSVLQVTFSSDKVPEIAAIGLDNDADWKNGNPIFQLGGTQSAPRQFQQADDYQTGDGMVTYNLDLSSWQGETYTSLTFVNDADKAAALGSDAVFSDVALLRSGSDGANGAPTDGTASDTGVAAADDDPESGGGTAGETTAITFADNAVTGVSGQHFGEATVSADGKTLQLSGNAWKKLSGDFDITAETKLKLGFYSPEDAEMQAIGFMASDEGFDSELAFELTAEDLWTDIQDAVASQYATGAPETEIVVPVGEVFEKNGWLGNYDSLVFINDDDTPKDPYGEDVSSATFSNLVLYEGDVA